METPRHVFLVDGSGYIFRAFHGLPVMTRPDGTPVNAVYGFTTMLLRLVEDTDADRIAIIFAAAVAGNRGLLDLNPLRRFHHCTPDRMR